MRQTATTKIATCYRAEPTYDRTVVEIRRDNKSNDYVVTRICDSLTEHTDYTHTEAGAFAVAAHGGFTEDVREVQT